MSIEDLKAQLEDTYYTLSERVPYFPLVVLGILLILAAGIYILASQAGQQPQQITILVKNPAGVPVRGASVGVVWGQQPVPLTAITDDTGTATFSVPAGQTIDVNVAKAGYKGALKRFDTSTGTGFEVALQLAEAPQIKQVTLTFVGPDGKRMTQDIAAKLGCSGSGSFAKTDYLVHGGQLTVNPPENCGRITVSASVAGFKTANDNVLSSEWVVHFEGIERPKGKIEFDVRDADNGNFIDGVSVTLTDNMGEIAGTATTSFGVADFTLAADSYTAMMSDPSGKYGSASVQVSVEPGNQKTQQVQLKKDIKLRADAKVTDVSGVPIAGATITLLGSDGKAVDEKTAGADGNVSFVLGDDGSFTLTAYKDGYVTSGQAAFKTTDYQKGSEKLFTIQLQQCSAATCGIVRVRVVDENGIPVENAAVSLLDKGGFLGPYGVQVTDFNGNAGAFTSVGAGTYTALAQKFPGEGKSDSFTVSASGNMNITMQLTIGSGEVDVSAMDQSGNALPFATADIYTDFGSKLGTIALDATGNGKLSAVKADKRVYAIVRKDGYAPYFTSPKQVARDAALHFNVSMEQAINADRPTAEFLGLFPAGTVPVLTGADSGTTGTGAPASGAVQSMEAGNAYVARFLLRVPTGANLDSAGFFIRAGDAGSAANDVMFVESVNSPPTTTAMGADYNPPAGGTTPASGNAKWVSLQWNSPEGGKYEIEATVRVRQGATKGTQLPLYYRTWGVKSGQWLRDPVDNDLGQSQSTPAKAELYALSQQLVYLEGLDQECSDPFCFTTRLLDNNAGLYVDAPYKMNTFSPYTLEFVLTDNSQAILQNAKLSIRSTQDGANAGKDISIDSYEIKDADATTKSSQSPAFDVRDIPSGNLRQNKSISGALSLSAKTANPSALQFSLVANQNSVFNSMVPFTTFSQDDINISVLPETIPAFIPNTLVVSVHYVSGARNGFPVGNAHVILTKTSPDLSETVFSADTNAQGTATLQIPASSPGTKLTITVEKAGAGARSVEAEIASSVVGFSPAEIKAVLNRETKEQDSSRMVMQNLISNPLVVKSLGFSMDSRGTLDDEQMNNNLTQYIGAEMPSQGSQSEINVVTSLGSEGKTIDAPVSVDGKIIAEIGLKGNAQVSWIEELPYSAQVNLAEMPANAPCLSVSARDWKDSTLNSRSDLEFEVQNNCVTATGDPMELRNLQGTVEWSGGDGQVGQVELSFIDPNTGESSSELLEQGTWTRMSEKIVPRLVYAGSLSFVPKPNSLGKRGQFTVKIDAELLTNSGRQFVGASNPINGDITVTNLDQCIEITPNPQEGIQIDKTGDESQFTVDTSKCGPISVDLRFCGGGGDMCRGGTHEGGLSLRPWLFTGVNPNAGGTSRTIKVTAQDVPGIYGITVEARPAGGQWRQVAEISTTVKPDSDRYFDLDKYQFTVIGKGSTDDATLTNSMLQETVQVTANQCDWQQASSGPNFTGMGVVAGMVIGAVAGYGLAYAAILAPLAASGVGAVIAVVVIIIMAVLDDPCSHNATHPLQDYVINLAGTTGHDSPRYLPPDALNVLMSDAHISGKWNTDITDAVLKSGRNGKQNVGVVFQNIGITQQQPLYEIATFRATEHVHGDTSHTNGAVTCHSGDFGYYWINPGTCTPAFDTIYTQKFHLKFSTAEQHAALPKVTFDSQACQSGIDIGRTGKGALPRVKFNWSWKDNIGGIASDACDASNPDYVYCDATQFTIELNKKLSSLNEFLQANNYDLGCPAVPKPSTGGLASATNQLPDGSVGIYRLDANEDNGSISAVVTVKNGTASDQNLVVAVAIKNTAGFSDGCTLDMRGIPAGGQKQANCERKYDTQGAYAVSAMITAASNSQRTAYTPLSAGVYVGTDPNAGKALCDMKTTETYSGTPQILRFVESNPNIRWTQAIPDEKALLKLLIFNAYLMKDNYSKEFFSDFQDYYTNRNFEDTGTYFTSLNMDSSGQRYGFNRLMQKGLFKLTRKYVNTPELPGPGLYSVELDAYFSGGNWRLFSDDGSPQGGVIVAVNRIDDPFPESPFYSMPFDGLVGLQGDSFKRQNYGVAFNNQQNEMAEVSSEAIPFKTYGNSSGFGAKSAEVRVERGLYSLNVAPETRGMLLEVDSPPGNKSSIVFQPSNATPVMLKASVDSLTQDKLSKYYSLLESENPVNVGGTLAYWDGAGTCLDFTGAPVTEAFYQKPDRVATQDLQGELRNYYGNEWPYAVKTGDVYLRTIFYTNPLSNYLLKAQPGKAGQSFYTADSSGNAVPLKGIGGMPFNNSGSGTIAAVSSMQDVFSLAEDGVVCVSNNGNTSKFFWNPQKIYDQDGTQRNISTLTNSLEAGSTCIG